MHGRLGPHTKGLCRKPGKGLGRGSEQPHQKDLSKDARLSSRTRLNPAAGSLCRNFSWSSGVGKPEREPLDPSCTAPGHLYLKRHYRASLINACEVLWAPWMKGSSKSANVLLLLK
jgi:hypothetical protein